MTLGLIENALVASILAPLVWLLCRTLRPRPALAHLLWLVLLVKFIAPPVVEWPWSYAITPGAEFVQPEGVAPARPGVLPAAANPPRSQARPVSASEQRPAPAPERSSITTAQLLLGLWAGGALLYVILECVRYRRLRHSVARRAATPDWFRADVADLAARLRMRAPRIWVSDAIQTPFVVGVVRPRLYWPAHFLASSVAERRSVLTHELAHLRRRDPLTAWIELVAGTLFWWNPVTWWIRHELREAAERACDAWVVWAWPDDRRVYAEALLNATRSSARPAATAALGMSRSGRRAFERRLRSILVDRAPTRPSVRGVCAALALGALCTPGWTAGSERANDASFRQLETAPAASRPVQRAFTLAAEELLQGRPDAGLAIALVRGRELLWVDGAGSLGPDDPHPIGSATGALTATLCAVMRDRGELRFDDLVGLSLADSGPRGRELTLRHLLEHTAGLPREADEPTHAARLEALRDSRGAAGVEYSYSRVGHALLGQSLAVLGGASFAELLRREVLEPLGMKHSLIPRHEVYGAADGVHSTARDLARFVSLQLTAGSAPNAPLAPASVLELQRPTRVTESWIAPHSLAWNQNWTELSESYKFRASKRGRFSTYVAFSMNHRVGVVVLGRGVGSVDALGTRLMAEASTSVSDTREAIALFNQERFAEARSEYARLCELYPDAGVIWFRYGYILGTQGAREESLAAYHTALERGAAPAVTAYNLACTYATLGDVERGFEWLERALELGFRRTTLLSQDADLAALRSDPRFATLTIRDY